MKLAIIAIASISSLGLLACAGANQRDAADPWAGYQGTHAATPRATGARGTTETTNEDAELAQEPVAKSKAKTTGAEEPIPSPAPASKSKSSKATIQDASISSIDVDALGEAAAGSLAATVVSTDTVVGPRYELVEVQLQGATVQIIRAATTPDAKGPEISAPKARQSELSKTEAAWYDAEADVLVVVNTAKKASSRKLLTAIVKH